MLLITSNTHSILKPIKEFKYYKQFVEQYTLVSVSQLVAQCNLLPETFEGMKEENLDSDIDQMIKEISSSAKNDMKRYKALSMGMMFDPGEIVQEREERILFSEFFQKKSIQHNISNRELVIRSLNASAFLNYFMLLESSIREMYLDLLKPKDDFIKGSLLVKKYLKEILESQDIKDSFEKELSKRSKFFKDYTTLENLWDVISYIRNCQMHSNGYFDEKSISKLKEKNDIFLKSYEEKIYENESLTRLRILDFMGEIVEQIERDKYIIFNNSLENMIRNISIFIMESLYISIDIPEFNTTKA